MSVKETINNIFAKLPFRALAEKIPESAQAKAPVLKKAIPFANQIVCGLVVVIIVVAVACSGGGVGGGKPNPASDFSYDLTEDGTGIVIKGYTGGPGKVVIPAKIEDLPVLEIGDKAFDGRNLTFSFDINSGSSDVGSEANEKAGITAIVIPDTVRKIGLSAFANTAITSIVIPDSVTNIGSYIFSGCKLLTEIRLSDNLEHIPELGSIFSNALPALKKVNLPKNLKRINNGAFWYSGELTELIIPDTLQSVEFGEYASEVYAGKRGIPDDLWVTSGEEYPYPVERISFDQFTRCSKLPIATRQKIQSWGYKGEF